MQEAFLLVTSVVQHLPEGGQENRGGYVPQQDANAAAAAAAS